MTSYAGRHAELYDVFYADKPYPEEARFIHECLQRFGHLERARLLELACGTGRMALELERLGHRIVATDYSASMLACARRKAAMAGSTCVFLQQDMRDIQLPGEMFDAAICLFDSIGYVVENQAILQVLNGVRNHLACGGLFVFEFWHAPAMTKHFDPVRIRRWPSSHGELVRISETRLDPLRHAAQVSYTIFEPQANGSYQRLQEVQTNRYFEVEEMDGLLRQSGWLPLHWFAGYSVDQRIDDTAWHIVAVAAKS